MKPLLALLVCLPLAGCAQSPVGDAEAAHAGTSCEIGAVVTGFGADGAPRCAAPKLAGFLCPPREVVIGFDLDGTPRCDDVDPPLPTRAPSSPARSLSLTSNGALRDDDKAYTIASATPGLHWKDLLLTVNGQTWIHVTDTPCDGDLPGTGWVACRGTLAEAASETVDAGDVLKLAGVTWGQTLRILDPQANTVILTLTIA